MSGLQKLTFCAAALATFVTPALAENAYSGPPLSDYDIPTYYTYPLMDAGTGIITRVVADRVTNCPMGEVPVLTIIIVSGTGAAAPMTVRVLTNMRRDADGTTRADAEYSVIYTDKAAMGGETSFCARESGK